MDIWDWLQNLVNALAVPTFALLIWQIVRAETMRPVEAVHIQVTRLKANRNACIVKASTYGGYVMLSAWIAPIDGCTRLKSEDLRDSTDALANGDTIGIQLEQNREKATVIVKWVTTSAFTRRPAAHARRITIDLRDHDHKPLVDSERWRWCWYARPAHFLATRFPNRLSSWALESHRQTVLEIVTTANRSPETGSRYTTGSAVMLSSGRGGAAGGMSVDGWRAPRSFRHWLNWLRPRVRKSTPHVISHKFLWMTPMGMSMSAHMR